VLRSVLTGHELRAIVAHEDGEPAQLLRAKIDAGTCAIVCTIELSARELAHIYGGRLENQRQRGDSLWRGLEQQVAMLARCEEALVTLVSADGDSRLYLVFYCPTAVSVAVAYARRSDYPEGHPQRSRVGNDDT
jgi:hypothetical protein